MSVLGNISLSGLTITNSDYILAANLEVTTSLTVDNGASIALPNHSIADTALSTNVMLLDTAQDSTAPETFITTVPDVAPVQVQYYADESVIGAIQLYPQLSSGDALIVGSVDNANGFQIQGSNGYNSLRFGLNQINVTSDTQLNLTA